MGQTRPPSGSGLLRATALRVALVFGLVAVLVYGVAPLSAAEPTAQLGTVSGTVAVSFANGSALQPASAGTGLGPGDRVSTVGKASATIVLPGVGQVELGGETTVIIQELRSDGGTTVVTLQIVQGMIVNRLDPSGDLRLAYRVLDPSGAAVARATGAATFGVGRDENGNVTLACQGCGSGTVSFPGGGQSVASGQARTLTARGDVLDWKFGGSIYDALAEGAATDEDGGKTASGNRLPPGQRTGSRDDRRTEQEDDAPGQNNGPATATPTPPVGTTPTATATVTATATPTPTPTRTTAPIDREATISSFVYLPDPIQIRVGQTVRWTNLDNVPDGHTVTASDLSFTSPVLNQGDTYVRTFTRVGTITYFCEPHPFMTAFIEVLP